MYIEVTEGQLDPEWKVKSPLSFWDFRDKFSKQMLEYDPRDQLYPGVENMRVVTKILKKRRTVGRPASKSSDYSSSPDFVDKEHLCVEIKKSEKDKRLCGDLTCLSEHVCSTEKKKNGGVCAWCGKQAYTKCVKCGVYIHFFPQRGSVDYKQNCFLNYHDDSKFGLCRADQPLVGRKRKH